MAFPRLGGERGRPGSPLERTLLNPRGRTGCLGWGTEPDPVLGDAGSGKGQAGSSWGDAAGAVAPSRCLPGRPPLPAGGKVAWKEGEARFINQGLRIARVAFTAPPAPGRWRGMMQSLARLCSRSIAAPPVPYLLPLFTRNLNPSAGKCHPLPCPCPARGSCPAFARSPAPPLLVESRGAAPAGESLRGCFKPKQKQLLNF